MSPAKQKTYTVKEAAKLLGVSTNTLYKYLDEGKIKAKRIGLGRFKIFQNELTPFLDSSVAETVDRGPVTPEAITNNLNQVALPVISPLAKETSTTDARVEATIDTENSCEDIVFFRIFKAVTFLGLGFIYLFSKSRLFSFDLSFLIFLRNSGDLFINILPLALIAAGILNIIDVIYQKSVEKYHVAIDVFSAVCLGYFSLIALTSGELGLFIFSLSFTLIALEHIVLKVGKNCKYHSFLGTFARYSIYLSVVGGIVVFLRPDFFPIPEIAVLISTNKDVFLVIWLVLLALPVYNILFGFGGNWLRLPYFVLASSLAVIMAISLTFIARWDVSYFSFITGIFGYFVAWWVDEKRTLTVKMVYVTLVSYLWISATLVYVLFSLNILRNQVRDEITSNLNNFSDTVSVGIRQDFDERSSILASYSSKEVFTKKLSKKAYNDKEVTESLKEIYEKVGLYSRVSVYDKEGNVLGSYPRSTVYQGKNFSSKDFFRKTLDSYRPYVSEVSEDLFGQTVLVQTEPIFDSNNLVGILAINLDPQEIAKKNSVHSNFNYDIDVVDKSENLIFSMTPDLVGASNHIFATQKSLDSVEITKEMQTPKWNLVISSEISPIVAQSSSLNVTLSILLVVNSLFLIAAAMVASSKDKLSIFSKPVVVGGLNMDAKTGFVELR
jgi:excisionase family DNA binding protein